jgi:hypothetical protein
VNCKRCGRPFEPRHPAARTRIYCYRCSPEQNTYPRLAKPAEELLLLDDDEIRQAIAGLRRAMALKYPRVYRANPDGTVDYVGPTSDEPERGLRRCVECGGPVPPTPHARRYCSRTCSLRAWHRRRAR